MITCEANHTLKNIFTDCENFQSELNEKIHFNKQLRTTHQFDNDSEIFVNLIQEVAWNNTPPIKKKLASINYTLEIR